MKQRPILFTGPMVCALLDGRKTQTRRLIKNPGYFGCPTGDCPHSHQAECNAAMSVLSPYGVPGDQLWVRENVQALELKDGTDVVRYPADGKERGIENSREGADRWFDLLHYDAKRRSVGSVVPAIHMPRWASRVTLQITEVRAQRVQDISHDDCWAEGVVCPIHGARKHTCCSGLTRGYRDLWNSINGAGSWDANPWIWAVSFEVGR